MFRLMMTLLLVFAVLGPSAAHHDAPRVIPPDEVEGWREDLQRLATSIKSIHPHPFWRRSETEFDALVSCMDAALMLARE